MTSIDTREPLPSEQATTARSVARSRASATSSRADGSSGYQAEAGRYHLYVSSACPWAHRTIIYRRLKGLEDAISMTIVDPERDERGWAITDTRGTTPDPRQRLRVPERGLRRSATRLRRPRDGAGAVGRAERGRIVNNESSEIIRMLDREFDAFAEHPELHFCPDELRAEIDELNAFVYENVNDGVYRTGFARTQDAYERGVRRLFDALDELDARLATRRYLLGAQVTEADWRLFTTLAALRRGLRRALQVQPAPRRRLPEPVGRTCATSTSPRRRRHRRHGPHQAALLPHAPVAQPAADRAGSARRSTSPRRTAASASALRRAVALRQP